ncbi:periplasmic binding protein-like II [Thozetella sp. PMI_491]|nr:periplasmic binding protein-like II [Thozetella sp. PMI_491]
MALRAILGCSLAVCSQALDTVQYGAFLPTATYSIANQLGFFTESGLEVVFNQVPNSTAAISSVLSGQYDILTATVDNALNYRFNQKQNITVLGQLDQGPDLVFASIPSITSVEQLRGKPIIVDSPVSGYAYLLRKVLSANGLELANGDYYFMTVGGTATRYAALVEGALANGSAVYATILTYPVVVEGESLPAAQAPNILARISDYVAPITSSAFMAREASLSDPGKSALLARFLASMHAANKLLLNSKHKECSVKAIAAQLGISDDLASLEYASATDPLTGDVSPWNDFSVSSEGIMNVVETRKEYGGFGGLPAGFNFTAALVPGSHQLIDYSIRDIAIELYKRHPSKGNCTAICHTKGVRRSGASTSA